MPVCVFVCPFSPQNPHNFKSLYSSIRSKHQDFQTQRKECSEGVINKITEREELTVVEKWGMWRMWHSFVGNAYKQWDTTFNGWMEVVPVTDATTGQVGCKNRPGRGSPCKGGLAHSSLNRHVSGFSGLVVSRLPYVCGRWKAALGQLWGRIRLFCSLHMVIFEYPCFVRLTLLNQSQFPCPTPDFKANGTFWSICCLRKTFTLCNHCFYRG